MIRRLRKFILITGTMLSLLIAATFGVSARWQISAGVPNGLCLYLGHGAISAEITGPDDVPSVMRNLSWDLGLWNWWGAGKYFIDLPLYAVLAAVAIPTLLVWRFGPKPVKAGHCRCGYDLTGNESGICPECGVTI